jgi:RHS repeat-associated protein
LSNPVSNRTTRLTGNGLGSDRMTRFAFRSTIVILNGKKIPAIIVYFRALSLAFASEKILYLYSANSTKLRKCYYEDNHLMETTNYYPFGLEIQLLGASDNDLLYNSKELQKEAKLNWYDYGARFYDPVLGRWHVVDPLAETSRRWSPYTYCINNPIRFIDPDGMRVDDYFDENGNYLYTDSKYTDYIKIIISHDWNRINTEYYNLLSDKNASYYTLDNVLDVSSKSLQESGISSEAISNILTNIIERMPEVDVNNISNNGGINVIQYYYSNNGPVTNDNLIYGDPVFTLAPYSTKIKGDGSIKLTARMDMGDMRLFESVSNVQNALGINEYFELGISVRINSLNI